MGLRIDRFKSIFKMRLVLLLVLFVCFCWGKKRNGDTHLNRIEHLKWVSFSIFIRNIGKKMRTFNLFPIFDRFFFLWKSTHTHTPYDEYANDIFGMRAFFINRLSCLFFTVDDIYISFSYHIYWLGPEYHHHHRRRTQYFRCCYVARRCDGINHPKETCKNMKKKRI